MRNLLLLTLACLLLANVSLAIVDPDDNSMGIYFDSNADVFETYSPPYVTMNAYITLTNPTFDSIIGYEFGFNIVGNHLLVSTLLHGNGPIDVGGIPGNHTVGLSGPLATPEVTILTTVMLLILDVNPIYLTLHGAVPNSVPGIDLPSVYIPGFGNMSIGTSSYFDVPQVNAIINGDPSGDGVVSTEKVMLDQIKSLYR